jgi:hypothetical protein
MMAVPRRHAIALLFCCGLATPATAGPYLGPSVGLSMDNTYGVVDIPNIAFWPTTTIETSLDDKTNFTSALNEQFRVDTGTFDVPLYTMRKVVPGALQPDGLDYYFVGGGVMALTFNIALPDGTYHEGDFSAILLAPIIHTHRDGGEAVLEFTNGRFDPSTAALFGIRPDRLRAEFDMFVDFNYPDFDAPFRSGRTFGQLYVTVPEPALLALVPMGLTLALARRRRT